MLKGLQTAMLVEERAANCAAGRRPRVAAKEAEPDVTKDPEPEPEQAEARQEGEEEAEEAPPVAEQAEGRRRRGERLGLQRRRLQAGSRAHGEVPHHPR